jgi:hypothetical protein
MASASITTRKTKGGGRRYVVRFRLGGRAYPIEHGGLFPTMRVARIRRDLIAGELAAPFSLLIRTPALLREERHDHPRGAGVSQRVAHPGVLALDHRDKHAEGDSGEEEQSELATPADRRRTLATTRDAGHPSWRDEVRPSVDLYGLPLGAGGHSVRLNGRVYEAVVARLEKRTTSDLYHSALAVRVSEGKFVIVMAPIPDGNGSLRGVVAEGPVGSRWARSLRIFRYEIRRWRDGAIPDIDEAVESPQRLTDDPVVAQRVLDLVPDVPTPVWGRDELQAGEGWNSNSVTSWLIARSGLGVEAVHPPAGGRAPGWRAGLVVARRQGKPPD